MGYLHDAGFAGIPTFPTEAFGTVATWAVGAGEVSGSIVYACDATDETALLHVPVKLMSHLPDSAGNAIKGALLSSIALHFEIKTAALDAMAVVINKVKLGADGADLVISNPAFTYDSGHDDASERIDIDEHKMTITLTTPFYVEDDEMLWVLFTIDKAATSIFQFITAVPYFTFRA